MVLHTHTPNKYFTAGTGRNPFFLKYNFWMFVRSQSLIWGWRSPSAERISWHSFPGACGRHPWTQKLPISQPWRWADGSLVEKKQILDFWFAKILAWPKLDGNFSNFEMAFSKLHRHYIDEELSHWKFFCCHSHWLLGFLVFPSHMGVTQFFKVFCQPWHSSCKAWVCSACIFGVCALTPQPRNKWSHWLMILQKTRSIEISRKTKPKQCNQNCQGRPVAFISKNTYNSSCSPILCFRKNDIIVDIKITPHETDLGL